MTASATNKLPQAESRLRAIVNAHNRACEGRTDNYAAVTLEAGQAMTTLTSQYLSENSVIVLSPRTANAAAELAAGGCYISAKGNGSCTITHANNAQTDREFDVAWIG